MEVTAFPTDRETGTTFRDGYDSLLFFIARCHRRCDFQDDCIKFFFSVLARNEQGREEEEARNQLTQAVNGALEVSFWSTIQSFSSSFVASKTDSARIIGDFKKGRRGRRKEYREMVRGQRNLATSQLHPGLTNNCFPQ
jgi:hypothetical protein